MRRRITTAIVGVTAFVLLALGIPLAIIAERQLLDSEVVELQAAAAETLTEIALPIDTNELADIASEPDSPPPFAVYGLDGTLLFGRGPKIAEPAVDAALRGDSSSSTDGLIVVATPITDKNETVVGALRLSESLAGAQSRARRAWLVMAGAGVAALAIAWLIGSRIAKGLSRPLIELAALATRMGNGGVIDNHPPVGITEIDLLGTALVESSHRVTESLSRERRFSADVSHQLRTPLTGLRLKLEVAATNEQNQTLAMTTLDDLDRIDSTVAHLLAFARDAVPPSSTSSLQDTVMAAKQRFDPRATATERTLVVTGAVNDHVQASASSIEQVLDVLLDNALDHGQGQITMTLRAIAGGPPSTSMTKERSPTTSTTRPSFDAATDTTTASGSHSPARSPKPKAADSYLSDDNRPHSRWSCSLQVDDGARRRKRSTVADQPVTTASRDRRMSAQ